MPGEGTEGLDGVRRGLVRVIRVDADGGVNAGEALGQGDGGAASLNGSSDADNARDPQLGGSLDNGFDVSGEIREIEMGVSVDDQAELAAGPRCAGSEAIC